MSTSNVQWNDLSDDERALIHRDRELQHTRRQRSPLHRQRQTRVLTAPPRWTPGTILFTIFLLGATVLIGIVLAEYVGLPVRATLGVATPQPTDGLTTDDLHPAPALATRPRPFDTQQALSVEPRPQADAPPALFTAAPPQRVYDHTTAGDDRMAVWAPGLVTAIPLGVRAYAILETHGAMMYIELDDGTRLWLVPRPVGVFAPTAVPDPQPSTPVEGTQPHPTAFSMFVQPTPAPTVVYPLSFPGFIP